MAATRKKKRSLKPRVPSRVKRRKPSTRRHGHHSELWGLGLVAAGLFLGIVLYGGWDGGIVGGPIADGMDGLLGLAAYIVPIAFVVVGGLMVARSELVDFRPFRLGLAVLVVRTADHARLGPRRLSRHGLRRRARQAPRARARRSSASSRS